MGENLDDRAGYDPTSLENRILARVEHLSGSPKRLAAFLNGLMLDGTLVRSGLQRFMTLPPAEARRRTRARMAALISDRVAAVGCVTLEDLEGAGFSAVEIQELFGEAKRAARVAEMAV